MRHRIIGILEQLEKKIEEMPQHCFFNEAAGVHEIIDMEVDLDIVLPYSYKCFLNNYDGGSISGAPFGTVEINEDGSRVKGLLGADIFGVQELCKVYTDKSLMRWKLYQEDGHPYPFIPFCRTMNGELLIFVSTPEDGTTESPVFDACHEEFPDSWGMLYRSFSEFLETYIRSNGYVRTISYDSPTAGQFLEEIKK